MASWTIFVYICIATGRSFVFLLHLSPIAISLAIGFFSLWLRRRALPSGIGKSKCSSSQLANQVRLGLACRSSWIDRLLCYYPTVCAVLGHNYLPSFRLLYSSLSVWADVPHKITPRRSCLCRIVSNCRHDNRHCKPPDDDAFT